MSKPNYRVSLSFDSGRKMFIARAPELDPCTAEGATRAEAIQRLEEEIDAQLANMLAHGSTPPRSVDEEEFSGEITLKLSKGLHRELAYTAKNEGVDVDHLVGELVSASLSDRRGPGKSAGRQPSHDGNRHGGGNGNGNGNRGNYGSRGNNMALLDDRANFIEYVRNLDSGTGQPHRGGGHGGGGHGGPGGQGQNRNRRGGRNNHRGPGGPGGGGGGGRPNHGGPQGARPAGPPANGGGNPNPGNGNGGNAGGGQGHGGDHGDEG